MDITFAAGQIKWGYHVAATLTSCTVTKGDDNWALSATVADGANEFRLRQQPLKFVAMHNSMSWTWPVVSLQRRDGSIDATLGPRGGR